MCLAIECFCVVVVAVRRASVGFGVAFCGEEVIRLVRRSHAHVHDAQTLQQRRREPGEEPDSGEGSGDDRGGGGDEGEDEGGGAGPGCEHNACRRAPACIVAELEALVRVGWRVCGGARQGGLLLLEVVVAGSWAVLRWLGAWAADGIRTHCTQQLNTQLHTTSPPTTPHTITQTTSQPPTPQNAQNYRGQPNAQFRIKAANGAIAALLRLRRPLVARDVPSVIQGRKTQDKVPEISAWWRPPLLALAAFICCLAWPVGFLS